MNMMEWENVQKAVIRGVRPCFDKGYGLCRENRFGQKYAFLYALSISEWRQMQDGRIILDDL